MSNTIVSPRGIAVWPKLINEPDEYQGKKFWSVNLRLTPEAAQPLIDVITASIAEFRARIAADPAIKPLDKKKKLAYADSTPVKKECDKEGNETGFLVVGFKTNYEYKDKLGQLKTTTVALFDAKGTPIRPATIWGGSEIKVSFEPWPYEAASSCKIGVSLRIKGVQILKLVSASGGGNASAFGFQAEEGYVAQANEQPGGTPEDAPDMGGPTLKPGDY